MIPARTHRGPLISSSPSSPLSVSSRALLTRRAPLRTHIVRNVAGSNVEGLTIAKVSYESLLPSDPRALAASPLLPAHTFPHTLLTPSHSLPPFPSTAHHPLQGARCALHRGLPGRQRGRRLLLRRLKGPRGAAPPRVRRGELPLLPQHTRAGEITNPISII
jgi:hypothetical protein